MLRHPKSTMSIEMLARSRNADIDEICVFLGEQSESSCIGDL